MKVRTLKFEELSLDNDILNGLKATRQHEATPLQQSIIENLQGEQNLLIQAEPGEDKNTALALAALQKVSTVETYEGTSVLILCGHDEAAQKLDEQLSSIGKQLNVEHIRLDSQNDNEEQAEAMASGVAIVIARPSHLQSLLKEHRYIFRHISLLILDGLDAMVANKESEHLKKIKRRILSSYIILIGAEELNESTKKIARSFAKDIAIMGFGSPAGDSAIAPPPAISGDLSQGYIKVPNRMKISTLMAYVGANPTDRCVIFTASKRGTDRLYRVLKKKGLKATSLHGKLSEQKRAQRFANFTNSDVQFLLVSDISAAELNLNNVVQVINYDVPNSSDEYRYRAALAGSGKAARIISLVSKQDRSDITELQNELGQTPDEIPLPDEVKQKVKQQGNKKRSNGRGKKGSNRKGSKKQKKDDGMQLPQPSYDKLSGGRSGNHSEKETGIVKFFKKLFS